MEKKFCKCGCKNLINRYDVRGRPRYFLKGHQTRTLKVRKAISEGNKGKPKSDAHKKKLSIVRKDLFARGILTSPSKYLKGIVMSQELKDKHSIANKGKNLREKNGMWKGGSWEYRNGIPAHEYKNFRMAVLKRDKRCLMCLSIKNLQVHHIIPVSEDRSKVHDVDNAMVLCKRCHIMTHSVKARSNPKYLREFLIEAFERMYARCEN